MLDNPEAQVLRRAAAGDKEAFAELAERYSAPLYGLCFSMLGNQSDAQDCVQETFFKAYRTFANFRQQSTVYTWLYRIAANTCYDLMRRRQRHSERSLDQPLETADGELYQQFADEADLPDEMLDRKETIAAVRAAIRELPENLRRILILRDIEGLAYEEIAVLENLRAGTVKSRLFRARKQLAIQLRAAEAAHPANGGASAAKPRNNQPSDASKQQQEPVCPRGGD
ncbi:MAG: sigma-70 family RNA polymerase sigma factor [Ruminococcaceae bacterium]|nr:sigma-70 family RNA polymerase sigma factor [Oscillospiraceae bacterium]